MLVWLLCVVPVEMGTCLAVYACRFQVDIAPVSASFTVRVVGLSSASSCDLISSALSLGDDPLVFVVETLGFLPFGLIVDPLIFVVERLVSYLLDSSWYSCILSVVIRLCGLTVKCFFSHFFCFDDTDGLAFLIVLSI